MPPLFWGALVLLWFVTLGERALITPDEGRYATLSLGMLLSGDWVTPRLNGILYFEKPALQYWAGALSLAVFGINEFAARFWPALTGLLSLLCVGMTARRFGWGGGTAALVFASSLWPVANSHFLSLDSGLSFFLTLALCAFLRAQADDADARVRQRSMWLAWAAMAGAVLSKGLVGIVIPGATLVLYSAVNRDWRPWRRLHMLSGGALFLLLAVPWFWLVSMRNPEFPGFFFIHEHFGRYLTDEHRRTGALWYFVPFLLAGFLPWTSVLPQILRDGWRRRDGEVFHARRFLVVWVAFIMVFFSLSHSKLPSYILPLFPALGLLAAPVIERMTARTLRWHLVLPGLFCLLLVLTYPFVDRWPLGGRSLETLRAFAAHLALAGIVLGLALAAAWFLLGRGDRPRALRWIGGGALCAVLIAMVGHNHYGQLKSSKRLVERTPGILAPDATYYSVRMFDQTWPFYLRRTVTLVDYQDEFATGLRIEPDKGIRSLDRFAERWRADPKPYAMMKQDSLASLRERGLPMRIVFADGERVVVDKP